METPLQTNWLPSRIPEEIQNLLDASQQHFPVIVVAPSRRLPLRLARMYEYVYLGYYRIVSAQISACREYGPELSPGVARGFASWTFRFQWLQGGEQPDDDEQQNRDAYSRPWWASNLTQKALPSVEVPLYPKSTEESDNMTGELLLRYRSQESLLPGHLRAKLTPYSDAMFPRGWHCPSCGMLSEQLFLRRRECRNSVCPGERDTTRLGVEFNTVRGGRGQEMPMVMPDNQCSDVVYKTLVLLSKEMPVFYYKPIDESDPPLVINHIFTCNRPEHQTQASEHFLAIQANVDLVRKSPAHLYFHCVIGADLLQTGAQVIPWAEAPSCLKAVRDHIIDQAQRIGEQQFPTGDLDLTVMSWVSVGSKKENQVWHTKERPLSILCLGNNTSLIITPGSYSTSRGSRLEQPAEMDLDLLIPFDDATSVDGDQLGQTNDNLLQPIESTGVSNAPAQSSESRLFSLSDGADVTLAISDKGKVKNAEDSAGVIHISMVHGDILILSGDDFTYSIKRGGTSMLVFVQ